jgi:hypothetical protein
MNLVPLSSKTPTISLGVTFQPPVQGSTEILAGKCSLNILAVSASSSTTVD